MKQTFSSSYLSEIYSKLESPPPIQNLKSKIQNPIHVVYGGAHLFKAETPAKFGRIALKVLETYAPNFVEFACAMWLKGADTLPKFEDVVHDLEFQLIEHEENVKAKNFPVWFAWTVYQRTIEKLETAPVEDFRIDFEDGYGIRSDAEEDAHSISASDELACLIRRGEGEKGRNGDEKTSPSPFLPFSPSHMGLRIKSLAPETYKRAVRTLDLFLTNLLEKTHGILPENFVVTLPKITRQEEVEILTGLLDEFERLNNLENGRIKIEIMIETPQSIVNEKGESVLRSLVEAGKGRVTSAHFGAYDYTASFGISGIHQHLRHEACNFARQMMQIALTPLGLRLSDSVTIEMPILVHKGEALTKLQVAENTRVMHSAWRTHFNNVTYSLIDGFYQSWDLHPAQLVARYAAVYSFFLESADGQAERLRGFIEKATRAGLTGNTFDDAASAQGLLNFFTMAINCGAVNENEVSRITGLTLEELRSGSFSKIMENRQND